jgi:hypothetical protein
MNDEPKPTITDEERACYEGPDLASTLLVRLGIMEPSQVDRKIRSKRRKYRKPKDVIRAISDVAAELEEGSITPQMAKTRLYALQTLLVAMRMQTESDPQPHPRALPSGPLELKGIACCEPPEPTPQELNAELLHLQQLTAKELEPSQEPKP